MKSTHKVHSDPEKSKQNLKKHKHDKKWLAGMGIIVFIAIVVSLCLIQQTHTKPTLIPARNTTSRVMQSSDNDDGVDMRLIKVTRAPFHIPTGLPSMQTVLLTKDGFVPPTLTVKAGITVTFVNETLEDAVITSTTAYAPLNLGIFSQDDELSLPFTESGRYGYYNKPKPDQEGVIIVQ